MYALSIASRGIAPALARTTGSIAATDWVSTAGAATGAPTLPCAFAPAFALPRYSMPDTYTGEDAMMFNAFDPVPPHCDVAYGPCANSEFMTLPAARPSQRAPQPAQ